MLALWSVPYIIYWHSSTFELVGYHATNLHIDPGNEFIKIVCIIDYKNDYTTLTIMLLHCNKMLLACCGV